MYKYLLFDFDGTLIDTNEIIINALNHVTLNFLNREITEDELNSILGRPLENQMRCLCETYYSEMMDCYKDYYRSNQEIIREFPGVVEMLSQTKSRGCKNAIVSAKGRNGIENALSKFKLDLYFDAVVSAYDVTCNKPDPEPALKAMSLLSAEPEKALIKGDSPYDILCGKNAGIKTALVDWTIFPKEDLLKLNPDYILKSPGDLLELL